MRVLASIYVVAGTAEINYEKLLAHLGGTYSRISTSQGVMDGAGGQPPLSSRYFSTLPPIPVYSQNYGRDPQRGQAPAPERTENPNAYAG